MNAIHHGLKGFCRAERLLLTRKYAIGHILDLGCSDGALLSLFKRENIMGVDSDPKRIRIAKKYGGAICADILNPCLLINKKFDTVVCNDTLEHIKNKQGGEQIQKNIRGFYRNTNRLLKKGGYLILSIPLKPMMPDHPEFISEIPNFLNFKLIYKRYLSPGTLHIDNETDTAKIMDHKWVYYPFIAIRPLLFAIGHLVGVIKKGQVFLVYQKIK